MPKTPKLTLKPILNRTFVLKKYYFWYQIKKNIPMQKIYLTVFSICFLASTAIAQTILNDDFLPEVGDTLFISVDNLPTNINVLPEVGQHSWDFSNLQAPFVLDRVVMDATEGAAYDQFPSATMIIESGGSVGEGYYRVNDGVLELLGYGGGDQFNIGINFDLKYSTPYPERVTPLEYGDSNQASTDISYTFSPDDLPVNIFDGLPITADSLRIRMSFDRESVVDGWGSLTIPGGVFDVLREKRVEVRDTRLDAKLGFLGWQDVTDILLSSLPADQIPAGIGSATTTQYYFMSNEAKEVIALVTMDSTGLTPTNVDFKGGILDATNGRHSPKPGVYATPNPAIVNVRFEFFDLPKGNYKLKIFNILGQEVWTKKYQINGSMIDKVNVSFLNKGTYIYSLCDEDDRALVTKRMIILRP